MLGLAALADGLRFSMRIGWRAHGGANAPMVLGCQAGVEAAMQASGIPHGPVVARA